MVGNRVSSRYVRGPFCFSYFFCSTAPPVADEVLKEVEQAGIKEVGARGEDVGQRHSQPMQALRDGDTAVEQEGEDLIGNRRALTDEAGAHPVQGLQVELFLRFGGDKAHGGSLHRFGAPHRDSRSCYP